MMSRVTTEDTPPPFLVMVSSAGDHMIVFIIYTDIAVDVTRTWRTDAKTLRSKSRQLDTVPLGCLNLPPSHFSQPIFTKDKTQEHPTGKTGMRLVLLDTLSITYKDPP